MTTVKLTVPPDQTPAEEAALVAEVAAAIEASTGESDITFELETPEEVAYHAVSTRQAPGSRWG